MQCIVLGALHPLVVGTVVSCSQCQKYNILAARNQSNLPQLSKLKRNLKCKIWMGMFCSRNISRKLYGVVHATGVQQMCA